MLTEEAAWRLIARAYSEPQEQQEYTFLTDEGLCNALDQLELNDVIAYEVRIAMRQRIHTYMHKLGLNSRLHGLWPQTDENRPNRAALAMQFAEDCLKETSNKETNNTGVKNDSNT